MVADDPPEDLGEGAGAEPRLAGGLGGDPPRRRRRQGELHPLGGEVGLGPPQRRVGALEQDLEQPLLVQVLEQHHRLEAGEELRRHAVVEQVLGAQPVAQREPLLAAQPLALDHRHLLEGAAVPAHGDPVVDRVVEGLEGAGADEQQLAGVDRHRAAAPALGQRQRDALVLDQRQQRLLGADPGDVRRAADGGADLVDLVDEDDAAPGALEQLVDRRSDAQLVARPLEQPGEDRLAAAAAGGLLGQQVGVDADQGRAAGELRVGAEIGLHRPQQRRLAGAGGADQQQVAGVQAGQVLGDGDRGLAHRPLLAEHPAVESGGDLDRRRCWARHPAIVSEPSAGIL